MRKKSRSGGEICWRFKKMSNLWLNQTSPSCFRCHFKELMSRIIPANCLSQIGRVFFVRQISNKLEEQKNMRQESLRRLAACVLRLIGYWTKWKIFCVWCLNFRIFVLDTSSQISHKFDFVFIEPKKLRSTKSVSQTGELRAMPSKSKANRSRQNVLTAQKAAL